MKVMFLLMATEWFLVDRVYSGIPEISHGDIQFESRQSIPANQMALSANCCQPDQTSERLHHP